YIVDHCDLLIALRDENSSGDESGEAATIAYARKKARPVIKISAAAPHDISVEGGHGLNARSISGIERFNAFTVAAAEQEAYISNLCAELFKEKYGLPDEAKREAREGLMPFYVRASNLAKGNQKLYRRAGLLVYSFSALAVAAVAIGTLVHSLSPWAFALELLLLLSILTIVFYANRRRTHKQWIESRFLAERIRAAIFLAVCGVEASQISAPPYMGSADQPDEWMVMTFNEIWDRLPARNGCAGEFCTVFESFARESWIQDQIEFHEKKARDSERMSRLLERGGIVAFGLALMAAALHLILFALHIEWLGRTLILAAISLPAVGAAIGGIRTHREYSRLAKRSNNMAINLRRLDERFSSASDPQTLESLLQETERLMLLETQDWLMLMRFAKLETV
ncbi:MAG: SLATT domain-containing protein, partial [Acidobacteriota bacterium]|nr:SLATT domain-containing protein [Acidobacteriota bacterium]